MQLIEHLTLFLTTNCNLNCSYCYLGKKGKSVMDWHIAEKAIQLLLKDDEQNGKGISFFGGEPLLEKELLYRIAAYVRKHYDGIEMSVTTNGLLLDKETIAHLKHYGVAVILSLDGCGEEANHNRLLPDGSSCWSKVKKQLNEIAISDIEAVRMTVLPDNVDKLYQNLYGLYELGFRHINFALDYTSIWTGNQIDIYHEQYQKVLEFYTDCLQKGEKLYLDVIDNIIYNAVGRYSFRCQYGHGSIAISTDGMVFPCHREVLNTNAIKSFLYDFTEFHNMECCIEDEICVDCELLHRCNFCTVNIRKNGGSGKDIPEIICKINRIHIMETDKMAEKLFREKNKIFMERFY